MRDKVVFGVWAVLISLLLFGVVALVVPSSAQPAFGFLVPALAVMLAAVGVPMRRRIAFACATGAVFALSVLVWNAIIGSILGGESLDFRAAPWSSAGALIYGWFALIFPVAALVLFVGRRPSILWSRQSGRRR